MENNLKTMLSWWTIIIGTFGIAENYEHVKELCIENFHGLRSTKTAMEQTFEVMFKNYVKQAYTISHPAETICNCFLVWKHVSDKNGSFCMF
jgi:hypothetical protein